MTDTMGASDEFHHEPIAGKNWQENYVFHAFDASSNSGWFIHLGHIFDQGIVDVRVMTIINGVVTSATSQAPGNDCLAAPGLDVKVSVPLERMRLRYSGRGAIGPAKDGFFGEREGNVPFGFDIEMISEHPIVNWTPFVRALKLDPISMGTRYEQGARWKGKLWSGDKEIEVEGLLVRDHSWGPRAWHGARVGGFWTPMVFDNGKKFISGVISTSGNFISFSALSSPNGISDVTYENWIRINSGSLVARQFDEAEVLRLTEGKVERFSYTGHMHFAWTRHASFMDTKHKRGISDMYSTIVGEGMTGFGTLQHMTRGDYVQEGFDDPKSERNSNALVGTRPAA